MSVRFGLKGAAVVCVALCAGACQTAGPPRSAEPGPEPLPPLEYMEFSPAVFLAQPEHAAGRYPDLLTSDSYAVWVTHQVREIKRAESFERGEPIDSLLERQAAALSENVILIECHVASQFGDMSIAYDAVAFRGVEAYLQLPDGRQVWPIQTIVGSPVRESQAGTLKRFERTNVLIFPKRDLDGSPTVDATMPAVYLVLEGHGGAFQFEWSHLPPGMMAQWTPDEQTLRKAAALKFNELYETVRRLSRIFD